MTDAHCHPAALAERLPQAEAERRALGLICAASSATEAEFACHEGLAEKARREGAPPLLPCFAVHPQMPGPGEKLAGYEGLLELGESLARGGRLAALGETGFDLYSPAFRETEKLQDGLFDRHLETALQYSLPLVLHVRRAMHKVFARAALLKKLPALIFHSWPGTAGEGEALLRRGINAYFSFGSVILLNHKEARRCCASFPPERILAETDAPYQPLRGRGFSRWTDLPLILEGMAELRREAGAPAGNAGDLEKAVDDNFRRAFGRINV
ncbi:MAG: TatD family hydrolase [Treponema sp.]|nr:TatD family hydrolase [Treponema sp.]